MQRATGRKEASLAGGSSPDILNMYSLVEADVKGVHESSFHTKAISVGIRDATYVLDGLLYQESDLRIDEHYTDTAGFTDHVFGLVHLLGFRFAPRIRGLEDKRLFIPNDHKDYQALSSMIGGVINTKHIGSH